MYSNKDFERFYIRYQEEAVLSGEFMSFLIFNYIFNIMNYGE